MGLVDGLDCGLCRGEGAGVIYLASSSPRRRALLRAAGIRFRVMRSDYREKNEKGLSPRRLVMKHALAKALSVGATGRSPLQKGTATILAADTVVYFRGKIIGKPKNRVEALRTLGKLQGRWHAVWTGVAVVRMKNGLPAHKKVFAEKTSVKLRARSNEQIRAYFRRVSPLDKAGAYAIQSARGGIVEAVKGSFTNAVGLPMERLKPLLAD